MQANVRIVTGERTCRDVLWNELESAGDWLLCLDHHLERRCSDDYFLEGGAAT